MSKRQMIIYDIQNILENIKKQIMEKYPEMTELAFDFMFKIKEGEDNDC